jgi:hypothetical protein
MSEPQDKPSVLDRLDAENAERMRPAMPGRVKPEGWARWPLWQKAIIVIALVAVVGGYVALRLTN